MILRKEICFLVSSLLLLLSFNVEAAAFVTPPTFAKRTTVYTAAAAAATTTDSETGYKLDGKPIRGPITPLGNFVLVKSKEALSATKGGILLPDQSKERPSEGEVVAAGPGKLHPHTGVRIYCPVAPGDFVLYGQFAGTAMTYQDEEMQMILDDEIMMYSKNSKVLTLDTVIPCRDFVMVELEEEKLETSSGIVVAANVQKDTLPCEGVVVKVGEGRLAAKGEFTPSPVKIGDSVKFKDYGGNEINLEGVRYCLVRMVDILCTTNLGREEESESDESAP
eukprot:CAMPEP_0118717578 /NCGR_PEP_ID=MMETSP0800-20121206/28249_1 /TAXON_ID=210618 ORGANISM="Striatella unipunctata, Strain CCMP2910" /NCGR_SAMPLE_ID=MMETSP0800 /ASSEMBLY_ACC=CAM_ASM_000638 /LENGTH=278 /DNA_ID=CAMNT_0006624355 /DNA_START=95 /DNA_END=931 /DNA_ORIENTATION=+